MSEAEKTVLASLFEKVNKMDPQDAEAMLMCAAAYKAGKAAGEKLAAAN